MAKDNPMLDQPAELRKAAKLLSGSADVMAQARRAAMEKDPPAITQGEFRLSILRENAMRDAVTAILLMAIDSTVKGIQGSQAELEQAIVDASERIRRSESVKNAFTVFASLIGLAQAIVTGSPTGIIDALTEVKTATA